VMTWHWPKQYWSQFASERQRRRPRGEDCPTPHVCQGTHRPNWILQWQEWGPRPTVHDAQGLASWFLLGLPNVSTKATTVPHLPVMPHPTLPPTNPTNEFMKSVKCAIYQ
jgi:hypothetical protein